MHKGFGPVIFTEETDKECIIPNIDSDDLDKRLEEHFKQALAWMEKLGKEKKDGSK